MRVQVVHVVHNSPTLPVQTKIFVDSLDKLKTYYPQCPQAIAPASKKENALLFAPSYRGQVRMTHKHPRPKHKGKP
jgi:hypothetical protein